MRDFSFPIPPDSDDVGMSGDVEMSGDVAMSGDVEMSDGNRVRGGGVSQNYTLLSLRQITSESRVLPCGSSVLLVRNAYKDMDEILEGYYKAYEKKQNVSHRGEIPGVLVTGNPGIGKIFHNEYYLNP